MTEPLSSTPSLVAEYDLLVRCPRLAWLLRTQLDWIQQGGLDDRSTRTARLLDCYLMAAGLLQMLEDHLHRDVAQSKRISRATQRLAGPIARHARDVSALGDSLWRARTHLRSERHLSRPLSQLVDLTDRLGNSALSAALAEDLDRPEVSGVSGVSGGIESPELLEALEALKTIESTSGPLSDEVLRPPSCFRSYDQRPEDAVALAERFSAHSPDRALPLMVVGVRTSGSYLAPLQAAALRRVGYEDVTWATYRPGQAGSTDWEERLARDGGRGLVLVVDDPPVSGRSVVATVEHLLALGLHPDSVVLLVQSFDDPQVPGGEDHLLLPRALRGHEAVVLPWSAWSIHSLLGEEPVTRLLEEAGTTVSGIERLYVPPRAGPGSEPGANRRHTWVRYRVERAGAEPLEVRAEGVGAGWFGRQALVVHEALAHRTPRVLAESEGIMVREWLDGANALVTDGIRHDLRRAAREIARYVDDRAQALPAERDTSRALTDRGASWEELRRMLAEAFGNSRTVARPLITRLAQELCSCDEPAVIDGAMDLDNWYWQDAERSGATLKTNFFEGSFSNNDLYSYDPVFDLASAAASAASAASAAVAGRVVDPSGFSRQLLEEYESLVGRSVRPEQWFSYKMLHHWMRHRRFVFASSMVEPRLAGPHRESARREQRCMDELFTDYMSQLYFGDLEIPRSGAICAIDLDGVLETHWLAFAAVAPVGAVALRALSCHGLRGVIATGRSLPDVRRRCEAYRLAGGVAEYGSVIYDSRSGRTVDLLEAHQHEALRALARALDSFEDVILDPAHEHSVRASALNERGLPVALEEERASEALDSAGVDDLVVAVHGIDQTDFVCTGTDKGSGLRALAEVFGAGEAPPSLEMAIGDTISDVPMLRLAELRFAPSNATRDVDSWATRLATPAQLAVSEAVARVVGHEPGTCEVCRAPDVGPAAMPVVAVLAALPGGRTARAGAVVKLARSLALRTTRAEGLRSRRRSNKGAGR